MGKRISDPSIEATTYSTAVSNQGKLAVDWAALAEAKNIEIKFLGNARIQGSANGESGWTDTILSSHAYLRVSTDGGTQWILFKVSACNGTETSHPALTLTPTPYASLDTVNQVLTINNPVISGTNTGDETRASILAKLGITDISGLNTGDETLTSILTKLGITILSGDNTGDQVASTVPVEDTANVFTGENVEVVLKELYDLILSKTNFFTITLPAYNLVSERCLNAVEGIDYPTGWIVEEDVSDLDLSITHNLNRRIVDVKIFMVDNGEERILLNNLAYSGFVAKNKNRLVIESLSQVGYPIIIYLIFA